MSAARGAVLRRLGTGGCPDREAVELLHVVIILVREGGCRVRGAIGGTVWRIRSGVGE